MHMRRYQQQSLFCSDFFLFSSYFALFPYLLIQKTRRTMRRAFFIILFYLLYFISSARSITLSKLPSILILPSATATCGISLAADNFFDIGQRTGHNCIMIDVLIRHYRRNAIEDFDIENARYLAGKIELNGNPCLLHLLRLALLSLL